MNSAETFWYLATPYDKFLPDRAAGYGAAVNNLSLLVAAGVEVYSPIVHNHPIDQVLGRQSSQFWLSFDEPFMLVSKGLIVCKLATWQDSRGIAYEIGYFEQLQKPIIYMEPGSVPFEQIAAMKWSLDDIIR